MDKPTETQIAALVDFAARNGRNWKSKLSACWMNTDYSPDDNSQLLQQIRNQFGPRWLMRFKLRPLHAAAYGNTRPAIESI